LIFNRLKGLFILLAGIALLYTIPLAERTEKTESVGPGCTFIKIRDTNIPLNISILKIDLTNKSLRIRSVLARDTLTGEKETVLAMAQRLDREGNRVIGGVNSNFFSSSGPGGLIVNQGRLIKLSRGWSSLVFSREKRPAIGVFSHELFLTSTRGKKIGQLFLNRIRHNNNMVIYTDAYGSTTGSKTDGTAYMLDPDGSELPASGGRYMRIEKPLLLPQQNEIIQDKWVLSVGNKFSALTENIKTGELLFLRVSINPVNVEIFNAVSGGPRILRHGRVSVELKEEGQRSGFDTELHPRTAAGYTQNGQYLFLVVVDGRQPGVSIGTDLYNLARLMMGLGCYEALNLDGGGSSTLVVGNKIVNRPSEIIGPRPVANALLVISIE